MRRWIAELGCTLLVSSWLMLGGRPGIVSVGLWIASILLGVLCSMVYLWLCGRGE